MKVAQAATVDELLPTIDIALMNRTLDVGTHPVEGVDLQPEARQQEIQSALRRLQALVFWRDDRILSSC